ncbi:hypothetical protein M0R45_007079 [Rubus argutus]|uniref:Uncharacterized protein n=1 Tax=Rubus argutus TaxID=59490 RepID=A0AAW1YTR0_RUBAR
MKESTIKLKFLLQNILLKNLIHPRCSSFLAQDSIFNDDDEPVRNGEQNIEDKLKECEELLEKERLNVKVLKDEIIVLQREHTKNEDLKEEIKMLKLKLEIEEVKVIEYHEMLCEAQNSLKESTDHLRNVHPNNGHSLNFTTPPPTLGTCTLEHSGELNSWVVRLKRRKRRVKRMSGFVYFDGKKIKNPKGLIVIGHQPNIMETRRKEVSNATTNAPDDFIKPREEIVHKKSLILHACQCGCAYLSVNEIYSINISCSQILGEIPLWKGTSSAIFKEDVKELLTKLPYHAIVMLLQASFTIMVVLPSSILQNGYKDDT